MKHTFPEDIQIAYAICENCDNREFIVSGQTQTCNNCGDLLFRTKERRYLLEDLKRITVQGKFIDKNKILFPQKATIAYAYCNSSECNYGEYVINKETVICQYCMKEMELRDEANYVLNHETFQCPICDYEGLYLLPYNEDGMGSYETCPNCKFTFKEYDKKEIREYQKKLENGYNQFQLSKTNRKPGKIPPSSWPKLPDNLAGKKL